MTFLKDQDMFNKVVTLSLLVYCMGMFLISFVTGKAIDLQGFLILITPLIAHTIHLINNKTINAEEKVKLQQNGVTNNVHS
jgi:hypothetical protein